jgi:hypothetical protein
VRHRLQEVRDLITKSMTATMVVVSALALGGCATMSLPSSATGRTTSDYSASPPTSNPSAPMERPPEMELQAP